MSNKTLIARIANENNAHKVALETKIEAFAEVVRNTRRKMNHPAGFDWATHHKFKVLTITTTHIKVEASRPRYTERITLDIPRSDLSLSTWQVTGLIRRASADAQQTYLTEQVTTQQEALDKAEKAVTIARNNLAESKTRIARQTARNATTEAKREAARARRKARAQRTAQAPAKEPVAV